MTRFDGTEPRPWAGGYQGMSVADAPVETRADFIRKTYLHLTGAVLAFVALEAALFALVPDSTKEAFLFRLAQTPWMWLLVLGGFVAVSWIADSFARSTTSRPVQYAGLGIYVVAEAAIFLPVLWLAHSRFPGAIGSAALVTAIIFGALTAFVFITRTDFSWMRGILMVAGVAAMGLIAAGLLFGFNMGLWFVVPMIALACGYILYQTSALIHEYQPGQHVAASLALFASVALLFWYVLRLIMSLQRD